VQGKVILTPVVDSGPFECRMEDLVVEIE